MGYKGYGKDRKWKPMKSLVNVKLTEEVTE